MPAIWELPSAAMLLILSFTSDAEVAELVDALDSKSSKA